MANFCNKCGAPVSGIFCVKCGHDTRLATSPPPQPVRQQVASPVQVSAPPPTVPAASGVPAAKFCNKCGAPSIGAPFCNKCGAKLQQAAAQAQPSTPPQQPVPAQTVSAPQASGKGSPLTKILIGVAVVVIAVAAMAAGGVYYVVYRVKQKVHEVAREVPGLGSDQDNSSDGGSLMGSISKAVSGGSNSSNDSGSNGTIHGDPCRLLSNSEVGRAVGVQIVATQSSDVGCAYLAHGNSGDMTAKHMAAMMGTKGADAKTQNMIQGLVGGMAKTLQSEGHQETSDSNGNVPVFAFSVDNQSADAQIRVNENVLGRLGPGAQDIPGIGDHAFDEAGAMMMVRKGDKLIRIMYSTCPCTIEAIKPLAKTLADRL